MPRSSWSRIPESLVAAVLGAALLASGARAAPIKPDVCRGGHPARRLAVFYSQKIPRANPGTPLDEALQREKSSVEALREEARRYFLDNSNETLESMMDEYTFLLPENAKEKLGIGTLIAASDISMALKYKRYLWKQYIEKFTSVEEAPTDDPYSLRFEVSLDLSLFCRYRQKAADLVTQW